MAVSNVGFIKTTQGKVIFSSITILLNSFKIFPRVNATAKLHAILLVTSPSLMCYLQLVRNFILTLFNDIPFSQHLTW